MFFKWKNRSLDYAVFPLLPSLHAHCACQSSVGTDVLWQRGEKETEKVEHM